MSGYIQVIYDYCQLKSTYLLHLNTLLSRELPELAKIIVMRLLLLNQEVPKSTINSWVNSPYQKYF